MRDTDNGFIRGYTLIGRGYALIGRDVIPWTFCKP